jgi:hypothetical protein
MEEINTELTAYLEIDETGKSQKEINKARASQIALMAITIERFLHIMYEEIEKLGFSNLEFLSKIEMFLKCITPSYPDAAFQQLLEVLSSVDPLMAETRFYNGLKALRALSKGDVDEPMEMILEDGRVKSGNIKMISHELAFFTTFLIENLLKKIKELRKQHDVKAIEIPAYLEILSKQFDDCVIKTIFSIKTIN